MRKHVGKWGKHVGGFLSHLVTSFQAASYITGLMTAEYVLLAVHFFYVFHPHMISYAKIILMAVGWECRSVIFVYVIISWRISHPHTLEMS